MALPDELLEQAYHLANQEQEHPKQASLRRAISTAYYAVFHLLVQDVASHWAIERQRPRLARTVDHAKVRATCEGLLREFNSGRSIPPQLATLAKNFIELMGYRHQADYDYEFEPTRFEVDEILKLATDAFTAWNTIRTHDEAQDFQFRIFMPREPRK